MQQLIPTAPRLHPLVAAAAISVIAVSAAGIAAMTGILPGRVAEAPAAIATTATPAAAIVAPVANATPATAAAAPAAAVPTTSPATAAAGVEPAPVRKQAAPRARVTKAAAQAHDDGGAVGTLKTPADARESQTYGAAPAPMVASVPATGAAIPPPPPLAQAPVPAPRAICANCGVIEAVTENRKQGEGSGLGMAGGALGGAVVGKQFGKGRGQDFLTILGAVGGAYAGHQVEKNVRSTSVWEIRVRMEDGSIRTLTQTSAPSWRHGDRVRVDGETLSVNNA